jgi:hypothetical protein
MKETILEAYEEYFERRSYRDGAHSYLRMSARELSLMSIQLKAKRCRTLAVFEAIKSEVRTTHPTTSGLNSPEGLTVGTGEVPRDVVAIQNEVLDV